MTEILPGVFLIILCVIGYFYAWKSYTNNKYKPALMLLILFGLSLRIFISLDFYLHTWDEQFHALVAKNLMQHPLIPTLYENPVLAFDYKNWAGNHIWLHKQPLPLWSMALSMSLFGINEIALRLPSILLSTMGIVITCYIGKLMFNNKVGFIAAFLFSINGLIIELTGGRIATDHTDIFFLFFIELAVLFSLYYIKKELPIYNILVGVCIGAAILCKSLPALIVIPVWLLLVIDSKKFKVKQILQQLGIIIISCKLTFLPWQIYINNEFPREAAWESLMQFKHFTEVLDLQSGSFLYYIDQIRINYGELIYLPLGWFIWKSIQKPLNNKFIAISIWVIVPLIFFSFAQTKMQGYILFTAPALFIMTGVFWDYLNNNKERLKYKWIINLVLILLIILPVRYSLERIKPFKSESRSPQWVIDLKEINLRNINKGLLFNYDKPIQAMFYTNLTAYEQLPDKAILNNLIRNGYTVLIKDTGDLPNEIALINGIEIVK